MAKKTHEQIVLEMVEEIKKGDLGRAVTADFLKYDGELVGVRMTVDLLVACAITVLQHNEKTGLALIKKFKTYDSFVYDFGIADCSPKSLVKANKLAGKGYGVYELELSNGELVTHDEATGIVDYEIAEITDKKLRNALLKCINSQGGNDY